MIDLPAINLLGAVLGTKEGRISAAILADYHASARDKLLHANLLEPRGDIRAVAALTDHDDEPVSVIWSDNGHGYFCPDTGWVEVGADRLGMFGVNMTTLIAKTLSRVEILSGAEPAELIAGHVWEVGNARIAGTVPAFARAYSLRGAQPDRATSLNKGFSEDSSGFAPICRCRLASAQPLHFMIACASCPLMGRSFLKS